MDQRISEYDIRKQKVQTLRDLSVLPYAQQFDKHYSINDIINDTHPQRSIEEILEWPRSTISTAGRLMLKRVSGKLTFWQIMDETGTIQIMREHQNSRLIASSWTERSEVEGSHTTDKMLGQAHHKLSHAELVSASKDFGRFWSTSEWHGPEWQNYASKRNEFLWESTKSFDYLFVDKLLDVGDFVGIRGELFVTHKGERTLFVSEYQLLSKAIRPLGDKFHGIGDANIEKMYRQRYLDMIFNKESLDRMKLRSTFIKTLREFYRKEWFIELDTPILGNSASGAAANPFITHHNDFDTDMYLRIAPEIALKIATVGWLEKVFEIGKDFRNEGSSPSHHQEFLVIEHYAAYRNYIHNIEFTEKLFNYLFDTIPELKRTIQVADKEWIVREVTFWQTRERIDYIERIKQDSGIDVSLYGPEDESTLRELIKSQWFDRKGLDIQTTATMIDYLYKKVTRPKIIWPAFIYNYPKTMQPLARTNDENPMIVEQFQAIVNGWEILKAYSELIDPIELQANFDAQGEALARGDDDATKSDDEFVTAMEYGMPPQSWRGMGIDRILAMLTEQSNIRDVIMFPMMKPENSLIE